jgi:hypothetical protein
MSVTLYPGYSQQIVTENMTWQIISTITQTNPMIITTINNHGYVLGMIIGFLIPSIFGMQQLNSITGQVTQLTPTTLTINIDASNFTPFAYPSPLPNAYTPPTTFPVASGSYLQPQPLPFGNQDSFEGVIFNQGLTS